MKPFRTHRPQTQQGKSAFGNLLVLAVIGLAIWVGLQYVPQRLEAAQIDSILDQVEQRHKAAPIRDDRDLWNVINKHLNINEIEDMRPHFKTSWSHQVGTVTVNTPP